MESDWGDFPGGGGGDEAELGVYGVEGDGDRQKERHSAKGSFLAKVLGPVIDYGADYELAHFVYDLWMWSVVGGCKNSTRTPLRLALAGRTFSPEFWKTKSRRLSFLTTSHFSRLTCACFLRWCPLVLAVGLRSYFLS